MDRTESGARRADAAPTSPMWLRDQVLEELRNKIATGRLKPGDRLVERDLADGFGVSRVPVREAIRILLNEGVLEALSPRRIVVKEMSRRDVENLFDMREALEVLATRRATERTTPEGLNELARLLETARKATVTGRADHINRANLAYHHRIVELAGNELLAATLESLEGRLRWLFQQIDDPGALYEEHRALTEAIASRDIEAAADASLRHVRHYRAVALRMLFDEGQDETTGGDG
ncbi:GntR family transcriptional regulator [Streptomyces sp. NPDC058000]|uniref:GntR family transcriptional regulator n=1 Tax=Streptomyces sp. NPDC058000 TaxID=3346299 RepID=UPI0036E4010A